MTDSYIKLLSASILSLSGMDMSVWICGESVTCLCSVDISLGFRSLQSFFRCSLFGQLGSHTEDCVPVCRPWSITTISAGAYLYSSVINKYE